MQQWNQIQILGERGLSDAAIARKLSLDRETVAKWNGRPAPIAIRRSRASKLDAFLPYLAERLADFPELNARVLFREMVARGYDGGYERVKLACRGRFRGNAAYHLHKVRELVSEWGHDNVELALEQVVLMGAFHIRAVRKALRQLATLPPVQLGPPPRRVLYLPEVEQRSLKVYSDHVGRVGANGQPRIRAAAREPPFAEARQPGARPRDPPQAGGQELTQLPILPGRTGPRGAGVPGLSAAANGDWPPAASPSSGVSTSSTGRHSPRSTGPRSNGSATSASSTNTTTSLFSGRLAWARQC